MARDLDSQADLADQETSPGDGAPTPVETPWLVEALIDIANFTGLRRSVGCPRARLLADDAAAEITRTCPQGDVNVIGHHRLEFRLLGRSFNEVSAVLDEVAARFATPIDIDGEAHTLELAIGGAAAPLGRLDDVQLAEAAEDALAEAIAERVPVVRDLSSGGLVDQRLLRSDLVGALDRGELFLQYQPKIHVRREEIASAEALVRWQHPTRGLVMPGEFIGIAETSRLIGPITLWTLRQVMTDHAALKADGDDLRLFVNISGQLLADAEFVASACALIRGTEARIGFEITETSVIRDPATAIANLRLFADEGITVAIDDYGAGLSSLAYLKQLPASELKIDKLFVTQLTSSNRDPLIVRSTIDLAHAMEMEVTAEGVETPAALALLSVMGCDMIQGFLISRPLSIDAFRAFVRDNRHSRLVEAARAQVFRPSFMQRKRAAS